MGHSIWPSLLEHPADPVTRFEAMLPRIFVQQYRHGQSFRVSEENKKNVIQLCSSKDTLQRIWTRSGVKTRLEKIYGGSLT
jgi:hypothetical protein